MTRNPLKNKHQKGTCYNAIEFQIQEFTIIKSFELWAAFLILAYELQFRKLEVTILVSFLTGRDHF